MLAIALVLSLLNAAPLPPDVEQECEDHVAAERIVAGHNVVFSCELNVWLDSASYDLIVDNGTAGI